MCIGYVPQRPNFGAILGITTAQLKPASNKTLQNWWTVILIVQSESCAKYSKQFEGIQHRNCSFPSKIHMGHFPIKYTSYAVDNFFYINVCHLKKILMIFNSLPSQISFSCAPDGQRNDAASGWCGDGIDGAGGCRDGAAEGRWSMEGEGWKV